MIKRAPAARTAEQTDDKGPGEEVVRLLADQDREQSDVRLRGADEAGRRGQRPGGARVAHRPGVAGALGASPQIDRAVPVSARTSTCVMPILEISPSRISVRAHIRALTR